MATCCITGCPYIILPMVAVWGLHDYTRAIVDSSPHCSNVMWHKRKVILVLSSVIFTPVLYTT